MAKVAGFLAAAAVGGTIVPGQAQAIEPFQNASASLTNDTLTSGVAMGVADMNGDGLEDIVRLDNARDLEIEFQNPDGSFDGVVVGSSPSFEWSLAIGDIDGNGIPDVFTGGNGPEMTVWVGNDDGTSWTATELPEPPGGGIFVQCSNFNDIDGDGSLDLFVCDDNGLSVPYKGDGTGELNVNPSMIEAASPDPEDDDSGNYGSVWTDYDNDGDIDLYIAKCRLGVMDPLDGRRTNLLFRNDGNGSWTEVADDVGLRPLAQSWSMDFADIDNDGDLDAFLLNHDMVSTLYRNEGPAQMGTFTNITASSGIEADLDSIGLGIQSFFQDFDNDGFIDLMVTGRSGQHRLYMNDGDSTFTPAGDVFPTGGPGIQSAVVADLNHDGSLDLLAGFATGYNNPSDVPDRLFLNEGNENNWIGFRLHGVESNASAAGARVIITGAWGTQVREVRAGEGYGITNTLVRHFGLGKAEAIDSVTIQWPSGQVDSFDYAAINTLHDVTEGCTQQFFPDGDGDGVGVPGRTVAGCVPPKGYAVSDGDCADDDPNNYPGNEEVCDTADNNCNGEADEDLEECVDATGGDETMGVDDTGTEEGGDTDTGGADSSTGSPETPDPTMPATTVEGTGSDESTGDGGAADGDGGGGCGCHTPADAPAGWAWLSLLLIPLARRRKSSAPSRA